MTEKCAAVLVDEVYRVELPLYFIGKNSESLSACIEDIEKSTFTQNEKLAMLGFVKHVASELNIEIPSLSEVADAEVPAQVTITEENRALVYLAIEQLANLQEMAPVAKPEEKPEDKPEESVTDTPEEKPEEKPEEQVETPAEDQTEDTKIPENVAAPEETAPVEEPAQASAESADQISELQSKVEALQSELAAYKARELTDIRGSVADMMILLGKPLAEKNGNDKAKIEAALASRSTESLKDTYDDLVLEQESNHTIPEVTDPRIGAPESAEPLEELTQKLQDSIEESPVDIESYKILLGEDATLQIFKTASAE